MDLLSIALETRTVAVVLGPQKPKQCEADWMLVRMEDIEVKGH